MNVAFSGLDSPGLIEKSSLDLQGMLNNSQTQWNENVS